MCRQTDGYLHWTVGKLMDGWIDWWMDGCIENITNPYAIKVIVHPQKKFTIFPPLILRVSFFYWKEDILKNVV